MQDHQNSIALAHHWTIHMRGGELVLEGLSHLFPKAEIHTLFSCPQSLSSSLASKTFHNSPLQFFPGHRSYYPKLLPFFPLFLKSLSSSFPPETRLVFSSDASLLKGISLPQETQHVCYCHSPPRYLWDLQDTYLSQTQSLGPIGKAFLRWVTPSLKKFDFQAAQRVDYFIANSQFVQSRIQTHYQRNSTVIYPPVQVDRFSSHQPSEDFYLIVSHLVAYKRVDLAIQAFNQLEKKLVIIGTGPEELSLRRMARDNIIFLGKQSRNQTKSYFENCKAFLYPQIEDFGITAIEAQAAGKPVIAFAQGGALETVKANETGLFFKDQTPESLREAILEFEKNRSAFHPETCRAQAEKFNPQQFQMKIKQFLKDHLDFEF